MGQAAQPRFFVLAGRSIRGPLSAAEAHRLPDFCADTPVCPEDRDHKDSRNWTAAASFLDLFAKAGAKDASGDGGASGYWRCALAKERAAQALAPPARRKAQAQDQDPGGTWPWLLAPFLIAAVVLASGGKPPRRRAAPAPPAPASTILERAEPLLVPAYVPWDDAQSLRRRARMLLTTQDRQIVLPADGKWLKSDAVFSYDPVRRELRPVNDTARGLLDGRRPGGPG